MFPPSLPTHLLSLSLLYRGKVKVSPSRDSGFSWALSHCNAISLWICPFLPLSDNGERASPATSSAASSSRTTVSFCTSSANAQQLRILRFVTPLPSTFSIPRIPSTSSRFSHPPTHSTQVPFLSSFHFSSWFCSFFTHLPFLITCFGVLISLRFRRLHCSHSLRCSSFLLHLTSLSLIRCF